MEDAALRARRCAAIVALLAVASCAKQTTSQQVPLAIGPSVPSQVAAPVSKPKAAPRIVRVWVSQDSVSAGDLLRGHVTTTTNVASLEVRLGPKSAPLRRTTYGQFEGAFHVPKVPPFLRRSYTVDVIARNAAGVTAQTQITIDYR